MRRACSTAPRLARRAGIALIGALIVLGVVSTLMMTVSAQVLANRRLAERREDYLQADWLARAGVEMAAGRLLGDADRYRGETAEPLPRSQVRVSVSREGKSAGVFRVVSEARYQTDTRNEVKRTLTRRLRRVEDGGRVRVEVLPAEAPASR